MNALLAVVAVLVATCQRLVKMGNTGVAEGVWNELVKVVTDSRPLPAVVNPQNDLTQAERTLMQSNQKIAAIKSVRERLGIGLADAKRFVESFNIQATSNNVPLAWNEVVITTDQWNEYDRWFYAKYGYHTNYMRRG